MSSSIQSSVASNFSTTSTDSSNNYFQTYLRPFAFIVQNLPSPKGGAYTPLGDHLNTKIDFDVGDVLTAYKAGDTKGYAVLVFGRSLPHFTQAMKLQSAFEDEERGKIEWEKDNLENQPYGWLAEKADLPWMGQYKKQFVPFTVPENWIDAAFEATTTNKTDIYRVVRLFAPSSVEVSGIPLKRNNPKLTSTISGVNISQPSMSSSDSVVTDDLYSDGQSMKEYLQPYSIIVKNLPPTKSKNYTALGRHILDTLEFDVQKVLTVPEKPEEGGYAILEFGNTAEDFKAAMQLHIHFERAGRNKIEWEMSVHTIQPFGWLAAPEDVDDFVDKAHLFVPTSVPREWIEEAFVAANADTRDIYRSIRLFAARFTYIKFN